MNLCWASWPILRRARYLVAGSCNCSKTVSNIQRDTKGCFRPTAVFFRHSVKAWSSMLEYVYIMMHSHCCGILVITYHLPGSTLCPLPIHPPLFAESSEKLGIFWRQGVSGADWQQRCAKSSWEHFSLEIEGESYRSWTCIAWWFPNCSLCRPENLMAPGGVGKVWKGRCRCILKCRERFCTPNPNKMWKFI